jgi:cell division protein FtsW (lipid II flippase)
LAGGYDERVRALKIIVTEIQTNPSAQLAATALTAVLVIVLVTVLVVTLSSKQQKRWLPECDIASAH